MQIGVNTWVWVSPLGDEDVQTLVPMVAAWAILVDAPHVFATFSRTYFDREERRARMRSMRGE